MGKNDPVPFKPQKLPYSVPKPARELEVPVSFRIDRETKRLIDRMLHDARDRLGWVGRGEFFRWAVYEGLAKVVKDMADKRFTNTFAHIEAALALLQDDDEWEKCERIMRQTRDTVKHLEDLGMHSHVSKVLRGVQERIDSMAPDDWTVRLKRDWYREFGNKLRADRISNHPQDTEKEE